MADTSAFQIIPNDYSGYRRLNSVTKEIRLLQVLPAASSEDQLQVALVRCTLTDCPRFRALSYCWGSLESTNSISLTILNSTFVDSRRNDDELLALDQHDALGLDFNITENLHAALSSFRDTKTIQLIWADMLCINQSDVVERSEQVGFMKEIYTSADLVTVWLGSDLELESALFADENDEIFLFLRALEMKGLRGKELDLKSAVLKFTESVNDGDETQFEFIEQLNAWSSFNENLVHYQPSLQRLSQKVIPEPEIWPSGANVEYDEVIPDAVRNFLRWLHYYSVWDIDPSPDFDLYWDYISNPCSEVWACVEFIMAGMFESVFGSGFIRPPLSILKRMELIASSPWFGRAWVLQEVASNPRVSIRVNRKETEWDKFKTLLELSNLIFTVAASNVPRKLDGLSWTVLSPMWVDICNDPESLPIRRLVWNMPTLSTKDPRDILFAMYQLAADLPLEEYQPDYKKSVTETYSHFTRWVLRSTRSLSILTFTGTGFLGPKANELPSWVPNYHQLRAANGWGLWENDNDRAAGEEMLAQILNDEGSILRVSGFEMATITHIIDASTVIHGTATLADSETTLVDAWSNTTIPAIWTYLQDLYNSCFAKSTPHLQCAEYANFPQFTPIVFSKFWLYNRGPLTFHRVARIWAADDPNFSTLTSTWQQQQLLQSAMQDAGPLESTADLVLRCLQGRKLFFSHDGKLGSCPEVAQVGDKIVVLCGGKTPFLLRTQPLPPGSSLRDMLTRDPTYKLIGPCYLDGLKNGDKMSEPAWNDPLHAHPLDPDPCLDPGGQYHTRGVYRKKFFRIE